MKEHKPITIDHKRIIYTLSMLLLCTVAFVRAVGGGDWWNLAVSCVGFCIFPVTVTKFGFKSFIKIPYLIWLILSVPVAAFVIKKYYYSAIHRMAFAGLVVETVFYGLIVIRLIQGIIKKEFVGIFKRLNPFFYVCAAFFILCTISINRALWPLYFGLYFIPLFLAPGDSKDDERLFVSLSDALIISFFLIQSFAFLHRPYDQIRYVGAYTNSNVNGMFYLCVYFGWLVKCTYLEKINAGKFLRVIHFLFACAMWSFACLTISRSTLVSFFFTTILYLVLNDLILFRKKFLKGFLLKGICMFCIFALSFPLVFVCVRYIPALRHHPIWITEYSEDFVHSFDPWNSEKYTDLNEFFECFTGRFDPENIDTRGGIVTQEVISEERYASPDPAAEEAQEEEPLGEYVEIGGVVYSYPDHVLPGTDHEHPAYVYENYEGIEKIFGIRKYIFAYFFKNLNFTGHKEEYPSVYILHWYAVPHAHNSYLQIAYCFGIIQGIIFTGMSLYSLIYPIVFAFVKKEKTPWYFIAIALWQLGMVLIGMLENSAFPGKMMFSVFFLSMLPLVKSFKDERNEKQD
ncbi:MAG: hypothetical protein K6G75_11825 [Lachnospiraceae bacterium]|nr:hypothetical protein [Lachnospiraceae bacterium]